MNVIFGAGGFAREVAWLLRDLAHSRNVPFVVDAFVAADSAPNLGTEIGGIRVRGESEFFDSEAGSSPNIYIAVGSPQLKAILHRKCCGALPTAKFPACIHPSVIMDIREGAIEVGVGTIICAGTIITTDVKVGDFVHINLNCTLGHDSRIGHYSTLSPGVHVSGGASIGDSCFFGTGSVILESLSVIGGSSIGAGATVVRNIEEQGTYVGTPARRLVR